MPPKKNLKLSAVRLRRLSEFSRGEFLAAEGGEMRSDYFKNRAPRLEIRLPLTKSRSCFGTKWELRPRAPFGFASARGGQAWQAKLLYNKNMDDNKLASNDPDEFNDEYFEELEEKLLEDADKTDKKEMPVSGKSVFEIERLKRKKLEEEQDK